MTKNKRQKNSPLPGLMKGLKYLGIIFPDRLKERYLFYYKEEERVCDYETFLDRAKRGGLEFLTLKK